jgi:P2 family phage major capsid protein
MNPELRRAIDMYTQDLARLNGVANVSQTFAVSPPVEATLEKKIQESSEFLSRINIMGVRDQIGRRISINVKGPIASRTDTTKEDRQPRDPHNTTDDGYQAYETEFDTAIRWDTLDAWSMFPEFQTNVRDMIVRQQAIDRMVIGWHGKSVAAKSDPVKNPMLEDMNIGWLELQRQKAPQRVLKTTASSGADSVKVGPTGKYKNLDALVFDLLNGLDPWYRRRSDLVVLCSRNMLGAKYFPVINQVAKPTEKVATEILMSARHIGGLPPVDLPFFPENTLAITTFDNLSIYYQKGSRRRHLVENPKRNQLENYESVREAYVLQDNGLMVVAENIVIEPEAA